MPGEKKDRPILESYFQTGFRPTEQNFANLIASSLNKTQDGIESISKNLLLEGTIRLNTDISGNPPVGPDVLGTIRWNVAENRFEGFDGVDRTADGFTPAGWGPLGGGGSEFWTDDGAGNISYDGTGNVTVGRTMIGTLVSGGDSYAVFNHRDFEGTNNFALAQTPDGDVALNIPSDPAGSKRQLLFMQNNNIQMTMRSDALFVGTDPAVTFDFPPARVATKLFVEGDIECSGVMRQGQPIGAGAVPSVTSDQRLKQAITPFLDGLETISKIEPISFQYNGKAGTKAGEDHVGLIAQELKKTAPYMVKSYTSKLNEKDEEVTELYGYSPEAFPFLLINAVKELKKRVEHLEEQLTLKPILNHQ